MAEMSTTRWRVVVGIVAVLVVAAAWVLNRDDDDAGADYSVTWAESEGHPGCVYDAAGRTVVARLVVEGDAAVTVTVTAYADENTSDAVGSGSTKVTSAGTISISFPVEGTVHVDEDGVAACRLEVD